MEPIDFYNLKMMENIEESQYFSNNLEITHYLKKIYNEHKKTYYFLPNFEEITINFNTRLKCLAAYFVYSASQRKYSIDISTKLNSSGKILFVTYSHEIAHLVVSEMMHFTKQKYQMHGVEFKQIIREMNEKFLDLIDMECSLTLPVNSRKQLWRWQGVCLTCNKLIGKPQHNRTKKNHIQCKAKEPSKVGYIRVSELQNVKFTALCEKCNKTIDCRYEFKNLPFLHKKCQGIISYFIHFVDGNPKK